MSDPWVERAWLNGPTSPSTGSIVVYHGPSPFNADAGADMAYVEVADCHQKVRLHLCQGDSHQDFLTKVETMRDVLDRFAAHLRSRL